MPKKNNNKKSFKLLKKKFFKKNKLSFGNVGIRLLNTILIKSTNMIKFILIFKKVIRKSKKTLKYFWINSVFSFSKTYKVKGSRMGKGKGKLSFWLSKNSIGSFLVEFLGIRIGRIKIFLKKLQVLLNSRLFLNKTANCWQLL